MKRLLPLIISFLLLFITGKTIAQSVLNPNDPIVIYNSASPPAQPPYGQIGKWVKTVRVTWWNTNGFKAYFYKGMAFRLKFPKTYQPGVVDGKKYPVYVFYHGRGEGAPIYDNDFQLSHGGDVFNAAVNNGLYDGFLLYPQSTDGTWGTNYYDNVAELLNIMATEVKADLNRVTVNGLSEGGYATWEFMLRYPKLVAGALPMSGIAIGYNSGINSFKFTPVWLFQGGKDGAPAPYTAQQMVNTEHTAGGNFTYKLYPTLGHNTWDSAWQEPDFIPFMNRASILKPWALFGRTTFCPNDTINVVIGIAPGFDGYEWQKDGVTINGATTNQTTVTAFGTYSVRVKRGTVWSEFSPTPLQITPKTATQTPPITIDPLASNVLPAPDGSTTVTLHLPAGYVTYEWQKTGNPQDIGTTPSIAVGPGSYIARVTEQYGCSSNFSAPYTVVSASGANPPDAISGLTVSTQSQTSLLLNWIDKPNPVYNETAFEVYRSATTGGPYKLVAKVNTDVLTYTDNGLNPNTTYYYVIRPINGNGAAPVSVEANGKTSADTTAPTAPANLTVTGTTNNSVTLTWAAATDNIAVTGYDLYINNMKAYSFAGNILTATAYGLVTRQVYNFYVIARDAAGNQSTPSGQVTAGTVNKGLTYKYYQGSWSTLPDFNALTPITTGNVANVDLTPRLQDVNYGLLWQGFITIPIAGTYTFETTSDDGSRFYFNKAYTASAVPTVNNDGLHGAVSVSSAPLNLQPGVYPIAATYFQAGGGESMILRWKCTQLGINSLTTIPNQYLGDTLTIPGNAPAAPGNLGATAVSFNKITLNWVDNSNNETGFEIYRSLTNTGTFGIIGKVNAKVTTFDDINVAPGTRYFYKIKAIGKFGESAMVGGYPYTAVWLLNNSYEDVSYSNNAMTGSGTTFSTISKEGTNSLAFNGTSNYASIGGTASGFLHDTFSVRTVALWIKANALDNNRIIFDMGGSDNGLALRINANKLEAAIASGNTSVTASAAFTSTDWTHVAVVYTGSSLRLYINGALSASANTSFSIVNTTTNDSRVGQNNGTNAFNSTGVFYNGNIDYFTVINQALSQGEIGQLATNSLPLPTALTAPLPAPPAAPSNLVATGTSPNTINLTWKDNATNATGFRIERSFGATNNFLLLTNVGPATNGNGAYKDSALFANQQYVYRIRATGDGGNSAFTANATGQTLNTPPVLDPIANQSARYDVVSRININAKDADGDPITYTTANLPAFVTLVQDITGVYLNVAPSVTLQGTYINLTVYAADNHGGKDSTVFNLTINDNYSPVIAAIPNVTLNEGDKQQLSLSATDQNAGDSLRWSGIGFPSFITITGNNRTATLNIQPGYADAGTYTVKVKTDDNNGGIDTKTLTVTVITKNPNYKLFVRFKHQTDAPAPWNNITGKDTYGLLNDNGDATSANLRIQSDNWFTWNEGSNTGNNSGVFPDVVLKEYYFFGSYPGIFTSANSIDMKLTGLDTTRQYSFKFMAGSNWSVQANNGTTVFTMNGVSKSVAVQGNTSTTVNFDTIRPNLSGEITFTASVANGTLVGYLNGFEVDAILNDGTKPAASNNLTVTQQNGVALLNWTNLAYNATSYEVHRAADSLGTYTLLQSLPGTSVTSYNDSTTQGSHVYYYKVRAVNSNGVSAFSNIAGVSIPAKPPVITTIADVKVRAGATQTVNITAKGDGQNVVTLSVTGLPNFGSFTDNGGGAGTFTFNPSVDNLGSYPITVTATDNLGASAQQTFNVNVTDANTTSTYFNFASTNPAGAPWNNISGFPYGGVKITNAVDETGTITNMGMTFLENWENDAPNIGMSTSENTGIYPDAVMQSAIYEGSSTLHTIKVTGLDQNKRYNFVFFSSVNYGINGTTTFVINGTTLTLNASYNTSKTVQINRITANSSGEVNIQVSKASGASYAYLNAMVVESYDNTLAIVNPLNLVARANDPKQITLTWSDRANNETGYEVWRAVSGSSYALVTTVGANVTGYTDNGLLANTKYYYKVRAINGGGQSGYSNMSSATTLAFKILVNFSQSKAAPAPWNNTNVPPQLGVVLSNMKDGNSAPTGVGIEIINNFDGTYAAGINTGNNSGIYPDNVMIENYGVFPGNHARFNVTGLNQTLRYNLVFFSSSVEVTDITTKYTVNGTRMTYLNAALNKSGTVTLYDIAPDQNGNIVIDIDPGTATSGYGLIAALTIQGHLDPATQHENGPSSLQPLARNTLLSAAPVVVSKNEEKEEFGTVKVYPNPFTTQFNVDIELKKATSVKVEIFDLSGKLLQTVFTPSVQTGISTLRINTAHSVQTTGMYILRITGNSNNPKVVKLFKQ
ncbi:fibronectin type III domain protein [Chitinophaga niastensis]|uniref:Fibronectin type III domain protein n=1 Tax=Chitinophaga niastensis TaxID=536980 RepID=A0A2P8HBZ2_CHINA|nr:fibronectin type III domain-containing protein [Chitinophaga niastensis]PSL43747.1 fibronectin type III domain protein [Chitinophaga niastensis]